VNPENPLILPDRKGRNVLALEQWAKNPKDFHALRDRPDFPPTKNFWNGSLIQVRGKVYALEGDRWHPVIRESQDSAPIPWSFQGATTAATLYQDHHYLPLLWPCVINKVVLRIYPVLQTGETFQWKLLVNSYDKVVIDLSGNGTWKAKEHVDIKIDEDDEVNIEFTHSAAIPEFNVQAFLGVERS
jgi:hypothetical protein